MSKQKILTVVICCYNSTKTILNTLESIKIKNFPEIDVFLIDDGSKDNLKDCAKHYLTKYPNQIHYFRKKNGNWGSCINFAIKKARSKYLCVLDSDDEYNAKSLKQVLKVLKKVRKNTDMVFCNYSFHYLDKNKKKEKNVEPVDVSLTTKEIKYVPFKKIPLFHLITIHSSIFSLKILRKIRPLPEGVCYTDNLLIYEALMQCKNVGYINKKIYLYKYFIRSGEQSISIEKSLQNFSHFETVFNSLLKVPIDVNNRKQVHIAKRFISLILYWLMQILSKDYSRLMKEKTELLYGYTEQIKKLEQKLDCGRRLEGTVFPLIRNSPAVALRACQAACYVFRIGYFKATSYDKETKKWAVAIGKIRRKSQRKKNRKNKYN